MAAVRGRAPLSLKQRLFWWLLLPLVALVPAGSFALYSVMRSTAVNWLDQGLGDTALALSHFIRLRDGEVVAEISRQTDGALRFDRFDHVYYLVQGPRGQALLGDELLAGPEIELRPGEWTFQDVSLGEQSLRLAAVGVDCGRGDGPCQVRVAETVFKRDTLRRELLLASTITMLLMAGALAAAGRLAIIQGLRPLDKLSADVEERALDRLAPLDLEVPAEVRPLGTAINRLFARLRSAASAQQEFIANAAHQLRTPLTSLRTEIELALLEPHDEKVEPLLKRLQASVDRSARLATQMLAMARADASSPQEAPRRLDLRELAAQAAEDWVPRAVEAGLDLGFELRPAPVEVQGFLLRELLANLVHNSLSYAGEGARITVRTGQSGGRAFLEVEDTGPGIAPEYRQRMLQRFQRGPASGGNGSGLGLAIAHDIAQRHGGSLSLHDGAQGQGLLVRLLLPLAEAPGMQAA